MNKRTVISLLLVLFLLLGVAGCAPATVTPTDVPVSQGTSQEKTAVVTPDRVISSSPSPQQSKEEAKSSVPDTKEPAKTAPSTAKKPVTEKPASQSSQEQLPEKEESYVVTPLPSVTDKEDGTIALLNPQLLPIEQEPKYSVRFVRTSFHDLSIGVDEEHITVDSSGVLLINEPSYGCVVGLNDYYCHDFATYERWLVESTEHVYRPRELAFLYKHEGEYAYRRLKEGADRLLGKEGVGGRQIYGLRFESIANPRVFHTTVADFWGFSQDVYNDWYARMFNNYQLYTDSEEHENGFYQATVNGITYYIVFIKEKKEEYGDTRIYWYDDGFGYEFRCSISREMLPDVLSHLTVEKVCFEPQLAE